MLKLYKNRTITFILFIISVFFVFVSTSCTSNASSEISLLDDSEVCSQTETSQSDNNQKYQEFNLSVNNFSYFFDFTCSRDISADQDIYKVIGVLDYAYYDNVIITFDVVYTIDSNYYGKEKRVYNGAYSIALNAAGDASFYCDNPELLKAIGWDSYQSPSSTLDLTRQITVRSATGTIVLF